jgi:ABC-type multidrug transport system fused ATPase/permease subunit
LLVVTVLGAIASPLMSIAKATSASGPFFDMIQSKRISTQGLRSPTVSSQSDIVFDSVIFAYPARPQTTVLKELSARFRSGKTTAMVGPSGPGKSTIIALIERWYELEESAACHDKGATQGRILIDGRNINTFDLKWWRTQIGLVEQEPVLFNDSVYNNVAAGLIGTQWEHESEAMKLDLVVTACREAFATEFIDKLPLVISQ